MDIEELEDKIDEHLKFIEDLLAQNNKDMKDLEHRLLRVECLIKVRKKLNHIE